MCVCVYVCSLGYLFNRIALPVSWDIDNQAPVFMVGGNILGLKEIKYHCINQFVDTCSNPPFFSLLRCVILGSSESWFSRPKRVPLTRPCGNFFGLEIRRHTSVMCRIANLDFVEGQMYFMTDAAQVNKYIRKQLFRSMTFSRTTEHWFVII